MTGYMQQFQKHFFNSIKLLVLLAFLHVAFYTSAQSLDPFYSNAQANQQMIQDENRSTSQIDPASNVDLPLGIGNEIAGKQSLL